VKIRRETKEEILINSVRQAYFDVIKYIENPGRRGYLAVLVKLKPQSRELIRAQVLDKKIEGEKHLRDARKIFREITGYYDAPGGIKE